MSIGAPLVGIDLLSDEEGTLFVLEANAVPGWRALAKTVAQDLAAHILAGIEQYVASADLSDFASGTTGGEG